MAFSEKRPAGPGPAPMDVPFKLWLARVAHGISPSSVAQAYADWLTHLATSPAKQAELAASAVRKAILWTQYSPQAWRGECVPCAEPAPHDKRFSPPEWHLPPFSAMAQAFLLLEQWWEEAMTGVSGVSGHHSDVAAFTMRQWLDMWSPSNFIATNPEVLREALTSGGNNLANGMANWWRDAMAVMTDGKPRGVEQFLPGKGVALTPGKVVMRNRLAELIQYEPATPTVFRQPVLIVPSWIMKYYILDLTPDDSLVKFLVRQGHTVFMLSWKNPDGGDRDLGMEDYLQLGVMAALDAVRATQPRQRIHAAGYCLGGTLLAIAAAALGKGNANPLETLTLLAAETDFHDPGELGLFIDESQIAFLEAVMAEHGYLDGRQMAGAFQLINSKDLVWSKLVHEYLMGARSPVTAMGAWNADATRMPARMHSEYLRRLYLHNDLAEGRYRAGGELVKLGDIDRPLFLVATERDHVSPWPSVYKIARQVSGPVTVALSSGGHNVGIVNPPRGPITHSQASYRLASHPPGEAPSDPLEWQGAAVEHNGSWWPAWQAWLAEHSSGKVRAHAVSGLRSDGVPIAAPGAYVHQR